MCEEDKLLDGTQDSRRTWGILGHLQVTTLFQVKVLKVGRGYALIDSSLPERSYDENVCGVDQPVVPVGQRSHRATSEPAGSEQDTPSIQGHLTQAPGCHGSR